MNLRIFYLLALCFISNITLGEGANYEKLTRAFKDFYSLNDDSSLADCYVQNIRKELEIASKPLLSKFPKDSAILPTYEKILNNLEQFLEISKTFQRNENDPVFMGMGIYTIYTFADILTADLPVGSSRVIKSETILDLIKELKRDPFNFRVADGVLAMFSKVDTVAIKRVGEGEIDLKINNKNDKDINISIQDLLPPGTENKTNVTGLSLKDDSEFRFRKKKVQKQVQDLVNKVEKRTEPEEGQTNYFSASDKIEMDKRLNESRKEVDKGLPIVYFEGSGLNVHLRNMIVNKAKIKEGAILPGLKSSSGKAIQSTIIRAKGKVGGVIGGSKIIAI